MGRGDKAIADFHKKLDKERERAESIRETARKLSRENLSLHRENRILGETAARVRAVTDENYWLRLALERAQFTNKKLTTRIAKLRAAGATLTKLPFDEAAHLRNVLRRSRRQKTTICRLHRENARLRRAVKAARAGRAAAEGRLARLRTARKVLSEKLSGMDVDLRTVLRRSRRHKTAIKLLAGKNARLRRAVRGMRRWCQGWIERVAEIFRLNDTRLEHYDPGLELQTPAFDAAQDDLEKAVERLFADTEAGLAALPDTAREGRALRSLVNHREGLCVFVDKPHVPATNSIAERIMGAPAIGRGLSFGSDSEDGAKFTAIMYSVVGTLSMNGIDVLRWLEAWLTACAENGGQPPDDLSPWLPWSMSEERRRELAAPE